LTKDFLDFIKDYEEDHNTKIILDLPQIRAISTGSLSLDACIGVGGIPTGRLTIFAGAESTAKTTAAIITAKNAILLGMKVLFVDAENMLNFDYAKKLIGEENFYDEKTNPKGKFIVLQPDMAEHVLDVIGKAILSGEFGLIILDSTGALSPKAEKDKQDMEAQTVALVPRLMSKFLRVYFHYIRESNTALLFISQIRDKIGVFSRMKLYELPGGHAMKHAASVIVWFFKDKKIKLIDEVVGQNIRFSIDKNKVSEPYRGYIFPLMWKGGIDTCMDSLDFCVTLGIIQKNGPYYKYKEVNIGRGYKAALQYLRDNPDFVQMLREDAINGITALVVPPEDDEDEEEV